MPCKKNGITAKVQRVRRASAYTCREGIGRGMHKQKRQQGKGDGVEKHFLSLAQ
jgi:dTDP-4-dehydrorhamnose 3,5-epimerase-like enzyme